MKTLLLLLLNFLFLLSFSSAEQCGRQAGGALCPNNLCCSEYGWCGSTEAYSALPGCQSQCTPSGPPPPPPPPPGPPPPDPTGGLTDIITRSQFDDMLKHRNDAACPARGFYTYDAFITAAKYFPCFCNNGDTAARKKELSAFFGQTSHETTGGWPTAPDGPYAWGYCFKEEVSPSSDYCQPSGQWPCVPGKRYYGRGPMQLSRLSWNYNYGQCGAAIGEDLLNNPDLVSNDPVISFKAAIWFWMTPQSPKPSCHAVINGQWQPSPADIAAGRVPGYGVTTNIINGGLECGHGPDTRVYDRIGFYQRYCGIFGVNTGDNLDCYNQRSFASFKSFLDAAM
ncbi:endochitinase CH25-like [Brassica napus]|uniref:endochitinase CH25-like n=1 Tax=Brassica napus TaxID=3708 RepID=UPI002078A5E4|nr:endochitinase CH25-like [Brassica napus]